MTDIRQRWIQTVAMCLAGLWTVWVFFQINWQQAKLAAEQARLQNALVKIDLERMVKGAAVSSLRIGVIDLGKVAGTCLHRFHVTCAYSTVNQGATRREVTYSIVHAYYSPLPKLSKTTKGEFAPLSPPGSDGAAGWQWLLSQGYYYRQKWTDELTFRVPSGNTRKFAQGGGGTSELDSGESAYGSLDLIISAVPNDLVGCELYLGLDGGATEDNRWRYGEYELLVGTP